MIQPDCSWACPSPQLRAWEQTDQLALVPFLATPSYSCGRAAPSCFPPQLCLPPITCPDLGFQLSLLSPSRKASVETGGAGGGGGGGGGAGGPWARRLGPTLARGGGFIHQLGKACLLLLSR